MMCASSRNLPDAGCGRRVLARGRSRGVIAAVLLACVMTLACGTYGPYGAAAWAASPSTAPKTGLEGGSRHSFGPDGQGKRDERIPMGGSAVDAYGNPIFTGEEEEAAPRTRPRPGAYGTRPAPPPSRPLPDLPSASDRSNWKF